MSLQWFLWLLSPTMQNEITFLSQMFNYLNVMKTLFKLFQP